MDFVDDENIVGCRKTFFIALDSSLLPETYLEDFLALGYEAYIVDDFRFCPFTKKVEIILNTFPDSILFFFVEAKVGVDWKKYIAQLQKQYEDRALIGVLYTKRRSEEERRIMEQYYLFHIGIQCGCIALEFQKAKNFDLIERIMYANQANGKRKNIRALCDVTDKANFDYKETIVTGRLGDISLSHFSFFPNPNPKLPEIPVGVKLHDVFISFNGLHFKTNASLALTHEINENLAYFFLFQKKDGTLGLDNDIARRLSQRIYKSVTDKVQLLMREKFDEYARANNKSRS